MLAVSIDRAPPDAAARFAMWRRVADLMPRCVRRSARCALGHLGRCEKWLAYAGTPTAIPEIMTSTGGKAGFGIAWLLGIPLPILLVVSLITRC